LTRNSSNTGQSRVAASPRGRRARSRRQRRTPGGVSSGALGSLVLSTRTEMHSGVFSWSDRPVDRAWRAAAPVRLDGSAMHGGTSDLVAAIVEREGRFLFGKGHSSERAATPGYWCPISGRSEPGEDQAEAVVREVFRETGLRVRALAKVNECPARDGSALMHFWRVELLDEAPALLANDERSELAWVTLRRNEAARSRAAGTHRHRRARGQASRDGRRRRGLRSLS